VSTTGSGRIESTFDSAHDDTSSTWNEHLEPAPAHVPRQADLGRQAPGRGDPAGAERGHRRQARLDAGARTLETISTIGVPGANPSTEKIASAQVPETESD
jgi:hypothetical protein